VGGDEGGALVPARGGQGEEKHAGAPPHVGAQAGLPQAPRGAPGALRSFRGPDEPLAGPPAQIESEQRADHSTAEEQDGQAKTAP